MYKILITGSIHQIGLEILRKEKDIEIQYAPDLAFAEIFKIIAPFHCILSRSETPVTRELIDEAPNLKVIARAAVGIGNIDVNYATEKGILVINTPGKNTNSAAELTIGLLLSALKLSGIHYKTILQTDVIPSCFRISSLLNPAGHHQLESVTGLHRHGYFLTVETGLY